MLNSRQARKERYQQQLQPFNIQSATFSREENYLYLLSFVNQDLGRWFRGFWRDAQTSPFSVTTSNSSPAKRLGPSWTSSCRNMPEIHQGSSGKNATSSESFRWGEAATLLQTPHPIEIHFGLLYPGSRSFGHDPNFVTIVEGRNVVWPINWILHYSRSPECWTPAGLPFITGPVHNLDGQDF